MRSIAKKILRHLADPESNHRRVAISFIWVGLFALVSRFAGAAREIAIAWRYGVSETVDAYVFVITLVSWPVAVWFSILTVVLVPLASRVRVKQAAELPKFQSELFGLVLLMGLALGIACWFGLPILLKSGLLGLPGREREAAIEMSEPLTFLLPMGLIIGLFSTWLMASGKHRNTLLEAVPALTVLLVLLLPAGSVPEPLVWGTLSGWAFQLVALAWPLRRTSALDWPRFSLNSRVWPDFRNSFGLMAVGQVLMSLTSLIDQFFAAHLPSGALSTLNYANRILALILSLLAIAIARALLPVLSEGRSKDDKNIDDFALRWAIWIFFIGAFLTACLWALSPVVVKVIFERGAFSSDNTFEVASLLQYAGLQIPFFGFSVALAQTLTSARRWSVLLISGVIGIGVKTISSALLTTTLSVQGLALSNMLVYFANSVFFLIIIKWNPTK